MIVAGPTYCALLIGLVSPILLTCGCASKKYVQNQISSVNQQLSHYEKQTNDRIAWVTNKQQSDIAQVGQRIDATNRKVAEAAAAATEARNSASRSIEESTKPAGSSRSNLEWASNYRLVDKTDIMFGFNKATLTRQARATLDEVAAKCKSMPSAVVELAGFTDQTGPSGYNLALSRQRAWAVERYLVEHNVPLRSIHTAGFGEGPVPEGLAPNNDLQSQVTGERTQLERRVSIRVLGPGENTASTGSDQ